MCLLIVKPAGVVIPSEHLINAGIENPHGAGIAFSDGKRVTTYKSAKWRGEDVSDLLADLADYPAIVHFRYATHGKKTDANTHPFPLPFGWVGAHNGVICGTSPIGDESDTRAFLREYVAPVIHREKALSPDHIPAIAERVGAGNKLAFLSPAGQYLIANEALGHWHGGAWYSNTSYTREWNWESTYRFPSELEESRRYVRGLSCDYCNAPIGGKKGYDSFHIIADGCSIACPDCAIEFLG